MLENAFPYLILLIDIFAVSKKKILNHDMEVNTWKYFCEDILLILWMTHDEVNWLIPFHGRD